MGTRASRLFYDKAIGESDPPDRGAAGLRADRGSREEAGRRARIQPGGEAQNHRRHLREHCAGALPHAAARAHRESRHAAGRGRDTGNCRALTKRFGDVVAVAGLDLTVAAGECFGLLGPNGAGKTSTIEILEGLTPPDTGDVEILGTRWREGAAGRALRERLGIQLQETQLADKLTVR